ncbi:MAG: hypothetical protein MJ244_05775 [Clostridia bacterium]|nr:hypothetical protein [Clostridia bacterium]
MKEKILKFEVPGKTYMITLRGKKPISLSQTHCAYSKSHMITLENEAKFYDDLVYAALEIRAASEKEFARLLKEVRYEYAIMLMGERFTTVDRLDNNSVVVRTLFTNSDGSIRKVLATLFAEEPFCATPRVDYDIALSPGDSDFDKYVKLFIKSYYDNSNTDETRYDEFTKKLSNATLNKYFDIRYVPKK